MKRQTILSLIFFFLFFGKYINGQDCPTGDVIFNNQAEADAFALQYPNCKQINGSLTILGSGTSPVLPALERVTGALSSQSYVPPNGFPNLQYIGSLYIDNSTTSPALPSLDSIGGNYEIYESNFAESANFPSFPQLTYIGGNLYDNKYSGHANYDVFDSLQYIGGNLLLRTGDISMFNQLDTIGGDLMFAEPQQDDWEVLITIDITGFNQLKYIGGDLRFSSAFDATDPRQINCVRNLSGLTQLNYIGGDFEFDGQNDWTCNLPIDDIVGMENLREIGGTLELDINHLANINFLSQLHTVGGSLILSNNYNLTNIDALNNNLNIHGQLIIQGNNDLSDCAAQAVCNHINGFGEVEISDNESGCMSVAEVQSQCTDDTSCLPQGITLTSQQEIDSFSNNYAPCLHILGEVIIEETTAGDITNLEGLESMRVISGGLTISNNTALTDLSGLDELNHIGSHLAIINNDLLTDIGVFQLNSDSLNLLEIINNINLETCNIGLICNYLNNNGTATISGNASGCESIVDVLEICNTPPDCLPDGIVLSTQSAVDNFLINYPYCSEIIGDLTIGGQGSDVTNLDALNQINLIGGDISITSTALETLNGLDSLSTFDGSLTIADNNSLISIGTFQDIDVFNSINIIGNNILQNVDVFLGDIIVNDYLIIEDNDVLNDLTGFQGLDHTYLDSLSIQNNPNLSECAVNGICNYLGSLKPASISNNTGNCNTVDNVLDNCSLDCECLPNGIDFVYQSEVNNFAQNYPGCTKILGAVQFGDFDDYGSYKNYVSNVDGLSHITYMGRLSVGEYSVDYGSIAPINFPNIDTLGSLYIEDMPYPSSNHFEGLNNLKHIENGFYVFLGNYALNSFEGLEQLNSIGGSFTVRSLSHEVSDFTGLDNLKYIGGSLIIEDDSYDLTSLTGLHNIESIGGDLIIQNNPNLSMCNIPSICNHLLNGGTATIQDNADGCDDQQEILFFCNDIAYLEVHTFYDINQNQIQDSNEANIESIVTVEPQSATYYTDSDLLYFLPGDYTITFDETTYSDWTLTTDSVSYFVNLEAYERDTISFGIFPDVLLSHMQTSVSSSPTRCNEFITFDVNTKNLGTTIADGVMWLKVDENILTTNFIDMPDTTVTPNLYGWFFEDLYPSQCLFRQIELQIPGPPDFPVGDYLFFDAYADFEDENGGQSSQTFTYEAEVRCSYDPNDKLVNPARQGDYTLFDENLIYTIRFQNTGNDVAYDVVIRDTLDSNLDLESFNVLGSSHADKLQTSMTPNGILTFEFRDIFLPDSTSNLEGSQGYLTYMISAIDGLAENTPITNSAGIYFDLNPPIITNTTQNVMVSELPVVSTTLADGLPDFTITPNPNKGIFQVNGIPEGTYQIHDTAGRIIQSGKMENDLSIDISTEVQGVYFISIQMENEIITKRIIKL